MCARFALHAHHADYNGRKQHAKNVYKISWFTVSKQSFYTVYKIYIVICWDIHISCYVANPLLHI